MWPHFTHLFWRILHGMPVLVSSNWASWLILIGTFVLTEGLLLGRALREGEEMKRWWVNRWKNLALGLFVTVIVYASLLLWSTVQTVFDDHHDSIGRWQAVVLEKNNLKAMLQQRDESIRQLEGKTCPVCASNGKLLPPKPTISELCETLTKCPTAEVQRRALLLADEIDGLHRRYLTEIEKAHIDSQHAPGNQAERHAFDERRISFMLISEYRQKYQGSALALRKELISRIGDPGENDSMEDTLYAIPNITILLDISTDLRRLANDRRLPVPMKESDENKK